MSVAEVESSSLKIPVNGVSVSTATFTVPPFLVAFFGTTELNLAAVEASLAFWLDGFPQAAKVRATPDKSVMPANTFAFFISKNPP